MDIPPGLPASIASKIEFSPIEDVILYVLREAFPDIPVHSLVPEDPPGTFILARRDDGNMWWRGDPRFVDQAIVQIDVFTVDPDGDEKGSLISEAVRTVMRDAGRSKMKIPGRGSVHRTRLVNDPSRKPDWATAQGPVQYADLPAGTYRYESKYELAVRRPLR